ncbi:HlyD family secretion protein [Vibrio sp. TBV020]|uniref:HlyD family secretion protein n=1 Tax=Vibrio sp. TBV020 TaxID=3137398 RepID=UPI0038CD817E
MLLTKSIKACLAFIVLSLMLYVTLITKFDVISEGEGVLSINDSNVNILSPSSGIIQDIYITRGDHVKDGTKLLTIGNIEDRHKRELLEFNSDFYSKRVDELSNDLSKLKETFDKGFPTDDKTGSSKLLKVKNQYEAYEFKKNDLIKKRNDFLIKDRNFKNQEFLLEEKSNLIKESLGKTVRYLDSKLDVEKIKLQAIESKLLLNEAESLVELAYQDFTQLTLDLISQTEDELRRSEEQLSSNLSEFNTVTDRIQSTTINSNIDGSVLSLKVGLAKGVYIERNSEILTLKRNDDGVYVDAKFDSKLRPYLTIGQQAKVKVDAPGIRGFYYGEIKDISVDSFEYDEYSKEGRRYYNVKISFYENKEAIKKLNGLLGLKTTVYVINDTMTFFEYITSVFNKDLDFSVW